MEHRPLGAAAAVLSQNLQLAVSWCASVTPLQWGLWLTCLGGSCMGWEPSGEQFGRQVWEEWFLRHF